jgi:hypothetical protein
MKRANWVPFARRVQQRGIPCGGWGWVPILAGGCRPLFLAERRLFSALWRTRIHDRAGRFAFIAKDRSAAVPAYHTTNSPH